MITVVCFKWKPFAGYRSTFTSEHVNVFARMVRRHYDKPMEIVCITDDAKGITDVDRVIPLWSDLANMRSPHDRGVGPSRYPCCYRRLKMFERNAGSWLGERIISMDLDVVITGYLKPIFDRREDFVAWGDTNPTTYYNGGLMLFTAGKRAHLWEEFIADPKAAIALAQSKRQHGSDQGWISARLGPNEARFTMRDGIYSYRCHIGLKQNKALPADARIVLFHGGQDPWGSQAQAIPWVRDNWR